MRRLAEMNCTRKGQKIGNTVEIFLHDASWTAGVDLDEDEESLGWENENDLADEENKDCNGGKMNHGEDEIENED